MYKFNILLPIYCGSKTLPQALFSIKNALIKDVILTLYVLDDNYPSNIVEIKETLDILENSGLNFKYTKSNINLGYSNAMSFLYSKVDSGIVVYFAQDDLLSQNFFSEHIHAYSIGASFTSRSFGMFLGSPSNVIREMPPLGIKSIFNLFELSEFQLKTFMFSLSQLSGLSFLKDHAHLNIHPDTFTAHIYPILSVALNHPGYYFDDYQVLCRIESSQTLFSKKIYTPPPTSQWMTLIATIFPANSLQFKWMKIDRSKNFVGLNQILLYSGRYAFFKELFVMIQLNPLILLNFNSYIWIFLALLPKRVVFFLSSLAKLFLFKISHNSKNYRKSLDNFSLYI